MWIRTIEVRVRLDQLDEFRSVYNSEIVPTVKAQKGNADVFLMESLDREGVVISFTTWDSQEDADAYEASGAYVKMVNKVKHTFEGTPTLWSYEVKK